MKVLPLIVAIGIPLIGGMLGGLLTAPQIKTWYRKLKKPKWNPPNYIFGPMCELNKRGTSALHPCMQLVWRLGFDCPCAAAGLWRRVGPLHHAGHCQLDRVA